MEEMLEKLKNQLKQLRLSGAERLSLRRFLLANIKRQSVRAGLEGRHIYQRSTISSWFLFLRERRVYMTAVIIMLVVMLGGGVSIAAENSLPGDLLHSIKVNVNEKIESSLAIGHEAKAKVAVDLAVRRLEETEQLAARGQINADVQAGLEERFEAFVDRVETRIEQLEAKGNLQAAAAVNAELTAALKAHERILARLSALSKVDSEAQAQAEKVLIKVRARLETTSDNEAKLESEIESKAEGKAEARVEVEQAALGMQTAVSNKIEEVEKFLVRSEGTVNAETTAEAQAKLDAAKKLVVDGEAKLEAKAFAEAFIAFREAHQTAQEAKLIVSSEFRIKLQADVDNEIDEEQESETRVKSEIKTETHMNIPKWLQFSF